METEEEKDRRLDRIFEQRRQTGRYLKGLILESTEAYQLCDDCGDAIADPYCLIDDEEVDYRTGLKRHRRMTCSTCHFRRAWQYGQELKTDEHRPLELPPAICECGKRLPDCEVATCHRPERPRVHSRLRKLRKEQRELFEH